MARNLAHQAEAIWPQEAPLFDRYGLSGPLRILDLGCGTGEITRRLAALYPHSTLDGVDILEGNLPLARRDSRVFGERISYEQGDAFALQVRRCQLRPGGVPAHVAGGAGFPAGAGGNHARTQARRLAAPAVGGLRDAAHAGDRARRRAVRPGPVLERECHRLPAGNRLRRPHRPAFADAAERGPGTRTSRWITSPSTRCAWSAQPLPGSCARGAMGTHRCWRKRPGARRKKWKPTSTRSSLRSRHRRITRCGTCRWSPAASRTADRPTTATRLNAPQRAGNRQRDFAVVAKRRSQYAQRPGLLA